VLSALLMFRRLARTFKYAWREEAFATIVGAGIALIVIGTLTYSLTQHWSVVDGLYFAVATLTTSSIVDPKLTITDPWMKIFTACYILIGIGILVEIARRLGFSFIAVREEDRAKKESAHEAVGEADTQERD
jgi:uncharacterized membrane protein YkgB